jgi:hypothetical protein
MFKTASASELYDFTRTIVKGAGTVRVDGPASNEKTVNQGFNEHSRLGAFSLSAVLKVREYEKNGPLRRFARNRLGERGWTDAVIIYEDDLDQAQNRHYRVMLSQDSCLVVVGDTSDPRAVVRSPEASDVAVLNQAISYLTYADIIDHE